MSQGVLIRAGWEKVFSPSDGRAKTDEVCQGVAGVMLAKSFESYLGKFTLQVCKSLLEVGPGALKLRTLQMLLPPPRGSGRTEKMKRAGAPAARGL